MQLFVKKNGIAGTVPHQFFYSIATAAKNGTLLNTGIFIPPAYWQSKQQKITAELPNQFGDAVKLNDELLRLKRVVENLVAEAIRKQVTDKGAFVKKAFTPTLDLQSLDERVTTVAKQEAAKKDAKQNIYYQFDEYIKTKERKVGKATLTLVPAGEDQLRQF